MTDRPIIFSGPMVRALLEGRKTQTRRLLPKAHPRCPHHNQIRMDVLTYDPQRPEAWYWDGVHDRVGASYPIPYAPGDRLYVREAHALVPSSAYRMSPGVPYAVNDEDGSQACVFREGWERSKPGTGWRPSIHMPRWASRLTLTVTEVRVQRLQDISEEDAWAEGCKPGELNDRGGPFPAEQRHPKGGTIGWDCARDWYADLWDSLHGPDAWGANPWVVAVTFTVDRRNIDSITPTT